MSARYDITSNQGETLHLHILYTDSDDNGIDLTSYNAEMKVKRTFLGSNDALLHLTGSTLGFISGITAGGTGYTGGITGGIFLNRNVGNSGSQTGGILVITGSTATGWIPDGRHQYDMEIKYTPTGETTRIIEGRFECDGEATR
tara:strand:- start:476 stop:907 length:432 start_codon:yes stop_codon:yes gene_type:complete